MQRFSRILFYLEEWPSSRETFDRTVRLAKQDGASLCVVGVFERLAALGGIVGSPVRHLRIVNQVKTQRWGELRGLAASARKHGIKADAHSNRHGDRVS